MLVKVFDRARSSLWIYYLVGYGVPALVVVLCVAISEGVGMGGYGTEYYCWCVSVGSSLRGRGKLLEDPYRESNGPTSEATGHNWSQVVTGYG